MGNPQAYVKTCSVGLNDGVYRLIHVIDLGNDAARQGVSCNFISGDEIVDLGRFRSELGKPERCGRARDFVTDLANFNQGSMEVASLLS